MVSRSLGIAFGQESYLYSFPSGHPFNNSRLGPFSKFLQNLSKSNLEISIFEPRMAEERDLYLFHDPAYVDFVRKSSKRGEGYLDYGDTPSYKGVFEASLYTVGSTLEGMRKIVRAEVDHFFNPVGGLHHARRDSAGGFCVFNDAAIAIGWALEVLKLERIAYVDIDAHHGDGVYYGYESDERVIIADIHEDGRYLYPGTGFSGEIGKGRAQGTKLNIPLPPGSGDSEFLKAFEAVESFVEKFKPQFILFQCGADGLRGDPLTHLQYTSKAHSHAAKKLHDISHKLCEGRLLAMGGGGYNPSNVESAWSSVVRELMIRV